MDWTVEVANIRRVGTRMVAIDLQTPPGFTAEPGQFVLVRARVGGESVARHYTISSPTVTDTFEITVESMPDGTLSRWLADLRAGARLRIEGPFGRIYYEGDSPVAVVAGGVGIGAAVGIGERAHHHDQPVVIVAHSDHLPHEDRLARLAAADASVYAISETVSSGVTQAVRTSHPLYVFGFRPFVDEVRDAIAAAGGDPDAAHIENYGPRE